MNSWSQQRHKFALIPGIIFVLLLSACGTTGTSAEKNRSSSGTTHLSIMVGGLSKQIYLPNELTAQLGYFSQEGLDVTLIDEASGQSSENEVLAGQVDAGSGILHGHHRVASGWQANAVCGSSCNDWHLVRAKSFPLK